MSTPQQLAFESFLESTLLGDDEALNYALATSAKAGLPEIQVSAVQARLLTVLAMSSRAQRVLEIGTLGGYSAICLARGIAPGGRVITLELVPRHAEVAAANIAHAGLTDRVEIRRGPADESLKALIAERDTGAAPFDLIFIDADKEGTPEYLSASIELARSGTMIIVDNIVRGGDVMDPDTTNPQAIGIRAMLEMARTDDRLVSTGLQTVGSKGWDGLLIATVR